MPLSSLALSFLVLHELTAIVPLVLLFWVFQILGTGAAFVHWISGLSSGSDSESPDSTAGFDWRKTVSSWVEEGEKRIERVGKRYGILGYPKALPKGTAEAESSTEIGAVRNGGAAGGVASALAAYVVVKVC